MPNIVVLGAGVSGLTSALLLAKNKSNVITVVAKHMPGDYDIEYASPWAGANYLPMAEEENNRWERETWPELERLARDVPEAGIHFQKALILRRDVDYTEGLPDQMMSKALYAENPWYKTMLSDYRDLDPSELDEGIRSACEWRSVCINTPMYLSWLVGQCVKLGVVFKRGVAGHISEAANLHHVVGSAGKADIVVNATGLLARTLGGVQDTTVIPVRGQIVVVRNEISPMMTTTTTDDGPDEVTYSMMRAAGGGTVLGGTYQPGNWDANPDPNIAVRIMTRALKFHPRLKHMKGIHELDVVRHGVGLRPYRKDGVRIEKEVIDGTWIVHNYGHAGWGYQASYGCSYRVVELVDEVAAAL